MLAGCVACTVHDTQTPPLTGPSEFALSVALSAVPDSITQDGASQSAIVVSVFDASGQPKTGVTLRVAMSVGGVVADYGQLSSRTLVTGADGKASTIYTAPAAPTAGNAGGTVSIIVTPVGSDARALASTTVSIRLVPAGVVVPTAAPPLAKFTVTPVAPAANIPAVFDASTSCGSSTAGVCDAVQASQIVTYAWTFSDGGTATGKTTSHAFTLPQTNSTTLTVTNDRGASASLTQTVSVGATAAPTASFSLLPVSPGVNDVVTFNGSASTAGAGHKLVSYQWTASDGTTGTGAIVTHAFTTQGVYTVSLKVVDEAGQSHTVSQLVTVTLAGALQAEFIFSPSDPAAADTIYFDATLSTSAAVPLTYAWDFGDGVTCSSTAGSCGVGGSTQKPRHVFGGGAHTWKVVLTVTDAAGRTAAKEHDVVTK